MSTPLKNCTDRELRELFAIAFSDITDYLTIRENAIHLKPLDEMDPNALLAVETMEVDREGNVSLQLKPKCEALEKLA